jgi:hypothetical protein
MPAQGWGGLRGFTELRSSVSEAVLSYAADLFGDDYLENLTLHELEDTLPRVIEILRRERSATTSSYFPAQNCLFRSRARWGQKSGARQAGLGGLESDLD